MHCLIKHEFFLATNIGNYHFKINIQHSSPLVYLWFNVDLGFYVLLGDGTECTLSKMGGMGDKVEARAPV